MTELRNEDFFVYICCAGHVCVLEHGLPEARIDEVFSDFSREPKDPKVGPSEVPLSEEERLQPSGRILGSSAIGVSS